MDSCFTRLYFPDIHFFISPSITTPSSQVNMALENPPRNSVVIIGAGTQGRRLAYMVRIPIPFSKSQFIRTTFSYAHQWSSRGNDVHLVDAQASQLQGSHEAIEAIQSPASRKSPRMGKVVTHLPDGLRTALQSAWLVVEVGQSHVKQLFQR